jgi:TetR/AcrR family tetracycline transcriptional repressor
MRGDSRAEPLSTEAIVDAAMRISAAEGYEAISMRRLADEFGVTAMALYGYVKTKRELLELVAGRYMARLDLADGEDDWRERLALLYTSFYELLASQPLLAHVFTQQTVDQPAAHRMADVAIGILRDAGCDDETAAEASLMLGGYALGMALARGPRKATERERQGRVRRLRENPGYPNLAVAAEAYANWPPEMFERGLRGLIDALELRPPASRRAAAPAR